MSAVPFTGMLLMFRYTCICAYIGAYRIHTCQPEGYHGAKPCLGWRIAVIACDQAK
jgi:hypothetical protein